MKNTIIFLFSIGWVVPLFLTCYFILTYLKNNVSPLVQGDKPPLSSFPYFHTIEILLITSAIWFALVTIGWSIYLFKQ